MKKIALITGIILSLTGFFQGFNYFLDFNILTQYGKGYVLGSILFLVSGLVLIFLGLKRSKQPSGSKS